MTLDVRERFLEDPPQLLLHLPRQATIRTYGLEVRVDAGPIRPALEVRLRERDEALLLGDRRAQLVQRLAELDHDLAHDPVQLGQRGIAVAVRQPVELEADVGEGLRGAVVQVAGDAGPLGLGAEGAQPAEPAGVVDRERQARRDPGEELGVVAR